MQQSIHNNILNNPIQRRENIVLKRQRGKWFWRIMYAITALFLLIPVIWGTGKYFYDSISISLNLLVIANVLVFVLVVIRAIADTSDSLYRERRSKTWELLMLTGVSNWRVVFGKWIGVMRHLVRDFTWLYVIRVGTLFWFMVHSNLRNDYTWQELRAYHDSVVRLFDIRIDDHYFIIALFLLLLFTILELMLSSSIGLATAFFKFKSKTSTAIAIGVRVGIAILLPLIVGLSIFGVAYTQYTNSNNVANDPNQEREYPDYNPEILLTFALRATTIFADNGAISIIIYGDDNSRSYTPEYQAVTLATSFGVVLYLLFTGVALSVAGNRAFVRGLDFETRTAQKMKRKRAMSLEKPISAEVAQANVATIELNTKNVFNIDNADTLSVEIYHYQRRLGRMILRITGDNLPQYVQLSSVAYVEAPAFWKGASFNTASDSECEQFIAEKGIFVNSLTKNSIRLYKLDGKTQVRILAGTAQILEDLPETI
ncbi:MAG: hypothetical protein Phog2KO_16090 [Phototrophicaceae bacterium]